MSAKAQRKKQELYRLNVDLTEHEVHMVDSVKELGRILKKNRDVVVNAIAFLSWGLKASFDGRKIVALDEKMNRYAEFTMPALTFAAQEGEKMRAAQAAEAKKHQHEAAA